MTGSESSPRMIVLCVTNRSGAYKLPSSRISHSSGCAFSLTRQRLSALLIAGTIPRESMTEAAQKDTAYFSNPCSCNSLIRANSSSRDFSVIFLESRAPFTRSKSKFIGTMIAPTDTGPASGPRPASSIPIKYFIHIMISNRKAGESAGLCLSICLLLVLPLRQIGHVGLDCLFG